VSGEFDRVEQLANELGRTGRIPSKGPEFLKKIGTLLLVEQRMVGRAEITEKPEILWDNPELEGLFARLEDEFELRERHAAIERKLGLIARTSRLSSSCCPPAAPAGGVVHRDPDRAGDLLTLYEMFVR
jgi:uncharacterized Rmd1/YagE family protein